MPSSDYLPVVQDVANWLRSRTKDTNGAELGNFTANTRPTAAEVTNMIAMIMDDEIIPDLGEDIDPALWPSAKRVAALRTALAIELSYYPEQVNTNRSPYNQLNTWFTNSLEGLKLAVGLTGEGDLPGSDAVAVYPAWGMGDYPLRPEMYEPMLASGGFWWPTRGLPNDIGPFPGYPYGTPGDQFFWNPVIQR